jgi:hypothetical protein
LATVQSANPVAADEGAGKKLLKGGAPEGSAKVIKATQCFVAGTPVATPDGWRNIEDIKEGDVVYAFNETTGEQTEQRVTKLLRSQTYWWVKVAVAGETIASTRTHRFWVAEENGWKEAKYLRAGEHLKRLDGSLAKIESVQLWDAPALSPTFNPEVETEHVFYVGNVGVRVYNGDAEPHLPSPDGRPYPQTRDMPGSRLDGLDKEHSKPKAVFGGKPDRLMERAMIQVDKSRADAELTKDYRNLVQQLRNQGFSPAEAETHAKAAMKDTFESHARTAHALPMDPAKMNQMCPR